EMLRRAVALCVSDVTRERAINRPRKSSRDAMSHALELFTAQDVQECVQQLWCSSSPGKEERDERSTPGALCWRETPLCPGSGNALFSHMGVESCFVFRVLMFECVMRGSAKAAIGLGAKEMLQRSHSAGIAWLQAHAPDGLFSRTPVCFGESNLDKQADEWGQLTALAGDRVDSHATHGWSQVMERYLSERNQARI